MRGSQAYKRLDSPSPAPTSLGLSSPAEAGEVYVAISIERATLQPFGSADMSSRVGSMRTPIAKGPSCPSFKPMPLFRNGSHLTIIRPDVKLTL